LKKIKVKINIK